MNATDLSTLTAVQLFAQWNMRDSLDDPALFAIFSEYDRRLRVGAVSVVSAPELSRLTDEELSARLQLYASADQLLDRYAHEAARRLRARDSAPSLHPLALAYLEAHVHTKSLRLSSSSITPTPWDQAHRKELDALKAWGEHIPPRPIWQTPPAPPSTESAQAQPVWCSLCGGFKCWKVHTDPPREPSGMGAPLSANERAAAEARDVDRMAAGYRTALRDVADWCTRQQHERLAKDRASREPADTYWKPYDTSEPAAPASQALPKEPGGSTQSSPSSTQRPAAPAVSPEQWAKLEALEAYAKAKGAAPAQGGTIRDGVEYIITAEADGRLSGRIPQRPGCLAEGDSLAECAVMLKRAEESWLLAVEDAERAGGGR